MIEDKVLVLESISNSKFFINHLKKTTSEILKSENLIFEIIDECEYFISIKLGDKDKLADAIELLINVSGISCLFLAILQKEIHLDNISQTAINSWKNIILDNESASLVIKTFDRAKQSNEAIHLKSDLEFHLQNELIGIYNNIQFISDEKMADKSLRILIGSDRVYISTMVYQGKGIIPLNLYNEQVACPIFDMLSIASLLKILNSGFLPLPIIFYKNRFHLTKILKILEKILMMYSINNVELLFISLKYFDSDATKLNHPDFNDSIDYYMNDNPDNAYNLIYQNLLVEILKDLDTDCVYFSYPMSPIVHPTWFIKRIFHIFGKTKKVLLTPLLFDSSSINLDNTLVSINETVKLNFISEGKNGFVDVKEERFDELVSEVFTNFTTKDYNPKKTTLSIRKNDIFDILDSI